MSLENYLGIFIDESNENLQLLNSKLLILENDPENFDVLNDIFRVAHTLKGMAKTMGFNSLADMTHHMENLLELLRSGKKKADSNIVDLLFNCLDKLEEIVNNISTTSSEGKLDNMKELLDRLIACQSDGQGQKTDSKSNTSQKSFKTLFNSYEQCVLSQAVEQGSFCKDITVYISGESVLPGARAFMINSLLEENGEIFKTLPSVEHIEDGNLPKIGEEFFFVKFIILSQADNDKLKEQLLLISEVVGAEINNLTESEIKEGFITELNMKSSAGILNIEVLEGVEFIETENVVNQVDEPDGSKSDNEELKKNAQAQTSTQSKVANQTIRINSQRLDSLMNLVGELVINKTRINQLSKEIKNPELLTSTSLLDGVTGEIQEIVMKLRMVQIDHVFNRFPRLVRDISKNLQKEVNLVIEGKEIEIDRAVIDEIGDPLVHLIRNSLDHGLETPEERIKAGKPAKGTLKLSAINEGDSILIKIEDDGRGIDPEIIKNKALAKGFVTEQELSGKSDSEIIELIFSPGFSTVENATDLSGRGVGMDVVRSKVNALGGTVNITSEKNKGTCIIVTLPSTMAIIQSLLVNVGSEIYAMPLNYISEVIDVHGSEIKLIQNREVITVRERTIPLVKLHEVLEVPDYVEDVDQPSTVVIIKSYDKLYGVAVSKLIGQQEVVIKSINKSLCSEDYISGATTLGSGDVALILNLNAIMN